MTSRISGRRDQSGKDRLRSWIGLGGIVEMQRFETLFHRSYKNSAMVMLLAVILFPGLLEPDSRDDQLQSDTRYREEREAWMRSEESPLALAGLFWLKSGANTFGADPSNDIVLPAGTGPARIGRFLMENNRVQIQVDDPKAAVTLNGQELFALRLRSDIDRGGPDVLALNELRLKIIGRGDRLAVRLIHLKNPSLLRFTHLDFYDIDPKYRVDAKFSPYRPFKRIKIASVTGQEEEMECPGWVQFQLGGKTLRMEPVLESPGAKELYFMFKDETNGTETYEGGRYLYSGLPQGGRVMLNFNQAHNPYCAYNSFTTCQLPPLQNCLKIPIKAGEKKYPLSKK